jgi:anti-sigma factor RsiW
LNALLGTHHEPAAVESSMLSQFGWRVQLPTERRAGFELVGSRLCLYGEGKMAHLMYRHEGQPVSIFMLPKVARPDEVVEVLGHEAVVWSRSDRTFVLVSRGPRAEAVQMASMIQVTLR